MCIGFFAEVSQLVCFTYLQIWNHDFFWESMKPGGGRKPVGDLLELIERDFGSFEKFVQEFKSAAATQFGSGWAWLACV
jgi:Fe-Mn family superoxide dismutase